MYVCAQTVTVGWRRSEETNEWLFDTDTDRCRLRREFGDSETAKGWMKNKRRTRQRGTIRRFRWTARRG